MRRMITMLVVFLGAMPSGVGATLSIDGELTFSRARITLMNGKHYLARHVSMEGDSISFAKIRLKSVGYKVAPAVDRDYRTLPLNSVSDIAIPDGNHAALGAGIGAIAGFALWGMAARSSNESMWEGAWLAIPFIIMPGAGIGALVGSGIEDWEPVYTRESRRSEE